MSVLSRAFCCFDIYIVGTESSIDVRVLWYFFRVILIEIIMSVLSRAFCCFDIYISRNWELGWCTSII